MGEKGPKRTAVRALAAFIPAKWIEFRAESNENSPGRQKWTKQTVVRAFAAFLPANCTEFRAECNEHSPRPRNSEKQIAKPDKNLFGVAHWGHQFSFFSRSPPFRV